jgi:pilus assembly protein CpaF
VITLQDLFSFDWSAGRDAEGRVLGGLRATGLRPRFTDKLADAGIGVPPVLFGAPGGMGAGRR